MFCFPGYCQRSACFLHALQLWNGDAGVDIAAHRCCGPPLGVFLAVHPAAHAVRLDGVLEMQRKGAVLSRRWLDLQAQWRQMRSDRNLGVALTVSGGLVMRNRALVAALGLQITVTKSWRTRTPPIV